MRVSELLDRDRFAARMGARLVEADEGKVVVEIPLTDLVREASGRISTGAMFSLADCALSLISNSEHTAVAVATHIARRLDAPTGSHLRAEATTSIDGDDRATTYQVDLTVGSTRVGSFTGTTLRVG